MDQMYLYLVVILAVLAIVDLVVGVSNDAVNFLNSAIGSKAISFKKIMIIASVGIFIGAVFSSGMMEVARKGIFVPSEFFFDEIMIIFLAVMITDILLLDFFNTIGMPTSTTVSIVFELLGAAVVMALIKISSIPEQTFADIWQYINTDKATEIVWGIILSVLISFTIGALVMWLSRLVFTFHYKEKIKRFGFVFAAVCLTGIGYFIFFKGLGGTPYAAQIKDVLNQSLSTVLAVMFGFWLLISLLIDKVFKKDVLVLVVGVGTFGLALSFSGNDLVNFIGVPMAAYHSYEAWSVSGISPGDFSMSVLNKQVPAEPLFLFIAGGVMVTTLWFSKKARTVVETSINLSRQSEGKERFQSNMFSRSIVRGSTRLVDALGFIIPQSIQEKIDKSFERPDDANQPKDAPAFDLIRASINLTVAGILISAATSMKLPLSTTYVTFMVAMGTSLADKAWGRDSAVYRIAGVLNVIGGWFFTAAVAFVVSGLLAYLIFIGGTIAIAVLLLLAAGLIVRNFLAHKNKSDGLIAFTALKISESKTIQGIIEESGQNITHVISRSGSIYEDVIQGLTRQDEALLKSSKKKVAKLDQEIEDLRNHLFFFIKNLEEQSVKGSNFYLNTLGHLTDMAQCLELMAKRSLKHVENNHKTLRYNQIKDLMEISIHTTHLLKDTEAIFKKKDYKNLTVILERRDKSVKVISDKIDKQISRTRSEETSAKNTTLYFNLLLETKDLHKSLLALVEEYHKSAVLAL